MAQIDSFGNCLTCGAHIESTGGWCPNCDMNPRIVSSERYTESREFQEAIDELITAARRVCEEETCLCPTLYRCAMPKLEAALKKVEALLGLK